MILLGINVYSPERFQSSISVSQIALFFLKQTLSCQVNLHSWNSRWKSAVTAAAGYSPRHMVRVPTGFGTVPCATTLSGAPKTYFPQLPMTKRPQLECDSSDAVMLQRIFFFFFCRNPTTNTPIVALFTYFIRNYIFVVLNILPRRRKKQGCSRRWHPFTKLCSVTLKDRISV